MQRLLGVIRSAVEFLAIELIARALYYAGILFLVGFARQRIGRRRLLIPMYHRVSVLGEGDSACLLAIQRGVPVQLFQRHLRIFRWFGPLLTLSEAFDHLHDATRRSRSVIALTFDDGYRDIVTLAVPALRDQAAKATIFPVVRTASGGRALWWDELADILSRARMDGEGLATLLAGLNGCGLTQADLGRVGSPASRAAMAELLCERLVNLTDAQREPVLRLLATRVGVNPAELTSGHSHASWDELRSAAADGCEVGGHTMDHSVLTCEEPPKVQAQVACCRSVLERTLGAPVRSFAYPNGRHDATVRALTAAAGYRCAVTVQAGVNYVETDAFELRRVPIHQERPFHLAFKLAFYGCVYRD